MRSICINFYVEIFNRNWLKDARVVDQINIPKLPIIGCFLFVFC